MTYIHVHTNSKITVKTYHTYVCSLILNDSTTTLFISGRKFLTPFIIAKPIMHPQNEMSNTMHTADRSYYTVHGNINLRYFKLFYQSHPVALSIQLVKHSRHTQQLTLKFTIQNF